MIFFRKPVSTFGIMLWLTTKSSWHQMKRFLVSGATYDVSGESSANSTAAQETGDVANRQRQ